MVCLGAGMLSVVSPSTSKMPDALTGKGSSAARVIRCTLFSSGTCGTCRCVYLRAARTKQGVIKRGARQRAQQVSDGRGKFLMTATTACTKKDGAAASVERRRREPEQGCELAGVTRARQAGPWSAWIPTRTHGESIPSLTCTQQLTMARTGLHETVGLVQHTAL